MRVFGVMAVVIGMSAPAFAGGFGIAVHGHASGSVVIGGGVAVYDDTVYAEPVYAEPPPPYPVYVAPAPDPCGCCGCAPPPVYVAPQPVIVEPRRESSPLRFGVGVAASSTEISNDAGGPAQEMDGASLLLRLAHERVEIEAEFGHDESADGFRAESRIGGALLFHVARTDSLSLYGLAGLGVGETEAPIENQRFGYGALGVGAALHLGSFQIGADVRWSARRYREETRDARPAGATAALAPSSDREHGVEGRLLAVFYF